MTRRPSQEDVELNVTAMLDMAFQLLAFFILTFRPPPGEDQIYLKLPPAQPVANMTGTKKAGADETQSAKDVKPTKTLLVTLQDGGNGTITDIRIGIPGTNLVKDHVTFNSLDSELGVYFKSKDEASGQKGGIQGDFEQVVINSSPTLHWEEVMKVVDKCAQFTTAQDKLPSVSFSSGGPDPGT